MEKYKEQLGAGLVTFGVSANEEIDRVGTAASKCILFKRLSTVASAVQDFCCMALCDEFIGTSGSTVTNVVKALNGQLGRNFTSVEEVGGYEVPTKPTWAFRQHLREMVNKSKKLIRNFEREKLTHEQQNVLDFLGDVHLAEFHKVIVNIIKDKEGPVPAAQVGKVLLQNRVAQMNRAKFQKCAPKEGGQHWLKALVSGVLWHYSLRTPSVNQQLYWSEDNKIGLIMKLKTIPIERKRASDSASSSDPPWKQNKSRHNVVVLD